MNTCEYCGSVFSGDRCGSCGSPLTENSGYIWEFGDLPLDFGNTGSPVFHCGVFSSVDE